MYEISALGYMLNPGDQIALKSREEILDLPEGRFRINRGAMPKLGGQLVTIIGRADHREIQLEDGSISYAYNVEENDFFWYDVMFEPAADFEPMSIEALYEGGE